MKNSLFLGILVVLTIVTHFGWLSRPEQVVFDEVHFGKFITAYCCTGERFFDIHPPHAKLVIAGVAYLGGYRGEFDFEHIGKSYGTQPVAALRFAAALAGALIPLIVYGLLREMKVSTAMSFLGGLVFALDNAFILQSRLIALDSMLIASTLGSLYLFLLAKRHIHMRQLLLYIGAGALAGFAVGVKFTGLAALATLGVASFYYLVQSKNKQEASTWIKHGLVILAGAFVVYAGGWFLHYALLPNEGGGDAWQKPSGSVVGDIIEMHHIMFDANYNLTATHPYSSKWWSWPFMQRPVFYWQGEEAALYFIGNPVVWWGGTILFVLATLSLLARPKDLKHAMSVQSHGWLILAGYIISFLPFIGVPRALFLYHYLTPLAFSLIFGLYWLDRFVLIHKQETVTKQPWFVTSIVILLSGFILFSPMTYAIDSETWRSFLYWFPTWR